MPSSLAGATKTRAAAGQLVKVYLAIRVSAMGFTLILPLIGYAAAHGDIAPAQIALLIGIAIPFHVFAYVLNDVVDLWVDRSEPLRADSPLVQGSFDARTAAWLAGLQPAIAFGLAWSGGCSLAGLLMLVAAFAGLLVYDLYGKRCPWPLCMDGVQALGWAALLFFGAWWQGSRTEPALAWLAAYVFVYVLLVNGFHGGLRDLANDLSCGARTTAVWLGARPGPGDSIRISTPLFAYAVALQAALLACLLAAVRFLKAPETAWPILPTALCVGAAALLPLAAPGRPLGRRRLIRIGAVHIVLILAVLPAIFVPLLSPAAAISLGAAFAFPILAMYLYNGTHWRL